MVACGTSLPTLPSDVNQTLFLLLLAEHRTEEALDLLPQNMRALFPTNASHSNVTTETCTKIFPQSLRTDSILVSVYGWILILTAIVGICGNSMVVVVYLRNLSKMTTFKWLLVHLACCDILFSAFQIVTALPAISNIQWVLKHIACKFLKSIALLGSLVAIGTMLVIAKERYTGILRPLDRYKRGKSAVLGLTLTWIIAIPSVIPAAVALKYLADRDDCDDRWDHSGLTPLFGIIYNYYLLVVFFLLPLVGISYCYIRIIKCLRKAKESHGFLYANANAEAVEKRRRDHKRTITMLIVVVVAFVLCVLPAKICFIIMQHIDVERLPIQSFYSLLYTGLLPYSFHVAVNPFIYSIVDPNFRKSVISLFGDAKPKFQFFSGRTEKTILLKESVARNTNENDLKYKNVKWQPLPQEVDSLS